MQNVWADVTKGLASSVPSTTASTAASFGGLGPSRPGTSQSQGSGGLAGAGGNWESSEYLGSASCSPPVDFSRPSTATGLGAGDSIPASYPSLTGKARLLTRETITSVEKTLFQGLTHVSALPLHHDSSSHLLRVGRGGSVEATIQEFGERSILSSHSSKVGDGDQVPRQIFTKEKGWRKTGLEKVGSTKKGGGANGNGKRLEAQISSGPAKFSSSGLTAALRVAGQGT